MTRRAEVEAHAKACRDALARHHARPAWVDLDLAGVGLAGADLAGADLAGADLAEVGLVGANLRRANLYRANLYRADLRRANLIGADLAGAYLGESNLRGADLRWADLRSIDLRWADLTGVDMRQANLRQADLGRADLTGADLGRADLTGADMRQANLRQADLTGTCLDPAAPVPPITNEEIVAAGLRGEVDADGVAWLVGWRSRRSLYVGSTDYSKSGEYVAPWFSVDGASECHPGIYLGGAPREYRMDRVQARCRRDEAVYVSSKKGVRTRCLVRTAADVAAGGGR